MRGNSDNREINLFSGPGVLLRLGEAHDAFGTLMMTLAHRARIVPPAATLNDLSSPTVSQTFEKAFVTASEVVATRWSRLEDDWRNGGRLAAAAWRTPALSCERALSIEEAHQAAQVVTVPRPKRFTPVEPRTRRRLYRTTAGYTAYR